MTNTGNGGPQVGPEAQQNAPQLNVLGQYIKDFSFENPRSPESMRNPGQPQVALNIQIKTRQLEQRTYEVALVVEADAKTQSGESFFLVELVYAGVFQLGDVIPNEAVAPVLLIECPRLLFPFARALVATITREAGVMPINIDLVDFAALYRQQLERAGASNGVAAATA
jgi:preprotein translocase subunit SecB